MSWWWWGRKSVVVAVDAKAPFITRLAAGGNCRCALIHHVYQHPTVASCRSLAWLAIRDALATVATTFVFSPFCSTNAIIHCYQA